MDHATRVLDAAETLFYDRGIQAVGMDAIRAESGVALKRLYTLFPSKDHLVAEYLRRRDTRWREALATHVATAPGTPVLAVFDWLHTWFSTPTFRGCAFINSFAELGPTSPAVTAITRAHKEALRTYLHNLLTDRPDLTDQVLLLIEGAIVTASITSSPAPAHHARAAVEALLSTRCPF
ncbi:TetR/AcrR family transcriptional regulator [Actinokineospora soli]|uniref:TetR/AcrR family transcriptional regulator n=1 Tax=Actinokineospora soli TaxID=1048753 RepID=A0ABW2TN53_9PSEU